MMVEARVSKPRARIWRPRVRLPDAAAGALPSAPGLGADVRELIVDPVARIARGDDPLQAVRTARPLALVHRQRRVDRVGELLDVERVDRQRVLAQLLVRARVLAEDADAVALVDQR